MATIVVAGAFPPETAAFATVDGVVRASVGVGPVAAGIGVAEVLRDVRPDVLVFCGTCGAYGDLPIDDVVVARVARYIDVAATEGRAHVPAPVPLEVTLDASLVTRCTRAGARAVDVATTFSVTLDPGLAALLRQKSRCEVEHLEAFSVALAAERARVPCALVLGVANRVGPTGSAEWQRNHARASARVGDVVLRAFDLATT